MEQEIYITLQYNLAIGNVNLNEIVYRLKDIGYTLMLRILEQVLKNNDHLIAKQLSRTDIYPSRARKGLDPHIKNEGKEGRFCRGRKAHKRGYRKSPSDPELENQINDRISFKKFLGLSFAKPSPDNSTFSRFRGRLSKEAMVKLNNEILLQFAHKGLTTNEWIAIDARLVKSSSRLMSNEDIKKLTNKRETPEGKVDKNGNPLKFSRDRESDWTIKNDKQTSIWFKRACLSRCR